MDDRIIDARDRFRGTDHKDPSGPSPDPVERERARKAAAVRLRQADATMSRLKATPRVPHTDRAVFAANLGRMVERAFGGDARRRLQELFLEAFGRQGGESHYKKRKRFLRLGDEEAADPETAGAYAAHGHDFVRLALAIGRLRDVGGTVAADGDRAAILRLVEGSGFDDRRGMAERFEAEQRTEFLRRLDQVVERVEAAVDLDRMRTWSQRHPVGAAQDEATGKLKGLSLIGVGGLTKGGWGARLEIAGETLAGQMSKLSPKVPLATLHVRLALEGALQLDLGEDEIKELGAFRAVENALLRHYRFPEDASDFGEWPEAHPYQRVEDHEDWIEASDPMLAERLPTAWLGWEIDLELRFDTLSDRWRPCLALGVREFEMDEDEEISGFRVFYGRHGRPYLNISAVFDENDYTGLFVLRGERSFSKKDSGFYLCRLSWNWPDLPNGIERGAHALPGEAALRLAFLRERALPEDLYRLHFEFPSFDDRFSPAPHDTIAGALLRNLAYAEPEKRIDAMLIADARDRASQVAALAETVEEDYRRAMECFEESGET